MKSLSNISHKLLGQPMFKTLSKVLELERAGRNILHFELGDPDFDTPANITDAACKSLLNGETHYTNSMGLYDFRQAVCETTLKSRGYKPSLEQVLVSPGANSIIYLTILCTVNPGDEVIIPDPGFPTYISSVKACNAVPVKVPIREEDNFCINPDEIEKLITDKTRLLIINSPSNPTGAVTGKEDLMRIYDIAEKHDIFLLSDEVYARMIYGDVQFASPSFKDQCKSRTIILNGFSKAFAMTGWRLGVAIGPEELIKKMGLLVETIVSCVPPFIQRAGIEAITGDQAPIKAMCDEYKQRRDILVRGLNTVKGINCLSPDGAIYVFPNIKGTGLSSDAFCEYVLDKASIALLPGNNFGALGEGYVRMCYASGIEHIEEAIKRLKGLFGEK